MASDDTPGTASSTPEPIQPERAQAEPDQPATAPQGEKTRPAVTERRVITVRRAPRYVPFLILGGLVGMAAAAAVAFGIEADDTYDPNSVFGFFMILFGAGGAVLGAVVALLLDRLSVRRAQHAVVEAVPENEPGTATGSDHASDTGINGQPGPQS
jgi:hypothetical protein